MNKKIADSINYTALQWRGERNLWFLVLLLFFLPFSSSFEKWKNNWFCLFILVRWNLKISFRLLFCISKVVRTWQIIFVYIIARIYKVNWWGLWNALVGWKMTLFVLRSRRTFCHKLLLTLLCDNLILKLKKNTLKCRWLVVAWDYYLKS